MPNSHNLLNIHEINEIEHSSLLTFSVFVMFSFSQMMHTGGRINLFLGAMTGQVFVAEALVRF